jgi:hypothetical protein
MGMNLLSELRISMKTLIVSIPLGKDEKVSGVVAVPDNFQKDTTAGVIWRMGPATTWKIR